MTKLSKISQYVPQTTLYKPAMMKFDGSTGKYTLTRTPSGNQVVVVAKFKRDPFTGNAYEQLWHFTSHAARAYALMFSLDTTSWPLRNARIQVGSASGTGADLIKLISKEIMADGEEHTLFYSYDADTADFVFKIDGVDADDAAHPDRVAPITGTFGTISGLCDVGAVNVSNYFGGAISFFGQDEQYLTNWSDFFDSNNNPIKQDESAWVNSGWGSQPLFWNEHGDMAANKGSAGDMTKNGAISVAPAEEFWNDDGSQFSQAQLRSAGAVPEYGDVMLDFTYPSGITGAYTAKREDALVWHPDLNLVGQQITLRDDGRGRAETGVGWDNAIIGTPADPRPLTGRSYQIWGECPLTVTPTVDMGFRIDINKAGGGDTWVAYFLWHASGYWSTFLAELVGGVWNGKGTPGTGTGIITPMRFNWNVTDWGDSISSTVTMYDLDNPTDGKTFSSTYGVASRNNKDIGTFYFGWNNVSNDEMYIRGMRVLDI